MDTIFWSNDFYFLLFCPHDVYYIFMYNRNDETCDPYLSEERSGIVCITLFVLSLSACYSYVCE